MPAGRPAKSVEQHKREGTYRPCRHDQPDSVEQGMTDDLKCPSHLKGIARNHWTKVTKQLKSMGAVKDSDTFAIEQLCVTYQALRNVEKQMRQWPDDGRLVSSHVKLLAAYKGLLVEMGLTPAARRKVINSISHRNTEEKRDPFAELLRGRLRSN